ncbi:hypothetical protein [Nonomuraea candida]|uniref:hypothetical protein n=1 Tax=Nonomuraea candida TaxID=359159 RepID=UPI0005BBA9B3|nr:hypothetical protein [Nonomuraea candida]
MPPPRVDRPEGRSVLGTICFNLLAREWGFGASMQATVWVEVGLLALTFALTYLLPRHARRQEHA